MKSFRYILLLLLAFSACEKSVDWELDTFEEPRLVVEAILTDENRVQEILLSRTYADLNGEAPAVTNAGVSVEVNQVSYNFLPDPQLPGRYLSEVPFEVIGGLEYRLQVDWEGNSYSASSSLSDVSPIPQPTFFPVGNTDSLRLGDFIPPCSTTEQVLYRIDIDWSHLVDSAEVTQARIYRYTFTSIDMSQLLPPPQEKVYFPRGSIVQIQKFGLNDDFAEYLRAQAIETDWNGTFFFSVSDNLPSNIEPEGLGFFSTCAVVRNSLLAE